MATPIQSTSEERVTSRSTSSIVEPETIEMSQMPKVRGGISKKKKVVGGISNAMSRYLQELAEAKKNKIEIPWK